MGPPVIQFVQVSLNGPFFSRVNHTPQLCVICKSAEGSLSPTVYVIDKGIKDQQPQGRALETPLVTAHTITIQCI